MVKSVSTNFVKDVIKNLGYYDSDKRNDGNYFFVPSYLFQNARADIIDASRQQQAQDTVNMVLTSPTICVCQQGNKEEPSNIHQLKNTIQLLQQRNNRLEHKRKTANILIINDDNIGDLLLKGLNRNSIQSDDYHCDNSIAYKELYRFKSWEYCKPFIDRKLSKLEQVLMTLMWIESNTSLQQLSLIFGYKSKSRPSRIINA